MGRSKYSDFGGCKREFICAFCGKTCKGGKRSIDKIIELHIRLNHSEHTVSVKHIERNVNIANSKIIDEKLRDDIIM
jgi:hypothetical protein